jgi:hypothetical protein
MSEIFLKKLGFEGLGFRDAKEKTLLGTVGMLGGSLKGVKGARKINVFNR